MNKLLPIISLASIGLAIAAPLSPPMEKTGFKLLMPEDYVVCPARIDTGRIEWGNPGKAKTQPRYLFLHSASIVIPTSGGYEQVKGDYVKPVKGSTAFKIVYTDLLPTAESFSNSMSCNYGEKNQVNRIVELPWGSDKCEVVYSSEAKDAKVTVKCKRFPPNPKFHPEEPISK